MENYKTKFLQWINESKQINELDSEKDLWPLPKDWWSKYYTVDYYMDGPRFFVNKTGEEVSYEDVINHYKKEVGNPADLF